MKILIVDDEKRMRDLLSLYLEPHGYETIGFASGLEIIEYLERKQGDLLILDVMMPEMDGIETAKQIRAFCDMPIIMLTAKDTSSDMIKGLKIGADDYITKPFEVDVLLARIEALLRRTNNGLKIQINGLVWDDHHHELTFHEQPINVTPKEFEMLGLLMKNPKKVFDREKLIEMIWGFDAETEGRTVDSHVRNIREKCRSAGFPIHEHLKTVWGVGYKWV